MSHSLNSIRRFSALYGILHTHYDRFNEVVQECMTDIVSRKSFKDPPQVASSVIVFGTLASVLFE